MLGRPGVLIEPSGFLKIDLSPTVQLELQDLSGSGVDLVELANRLDVLDDVDRRIAVREATVVMEDRTTL